MLKMICWNIARLDAPWRELLRSDADLALLQEAKPPPPDVAPHVHLDESVPWNTGGGQRPWRTVIAGLSNRVGLKFLKPTTLDASQPGCLPVSRCGTLSAAEVTLAETGESITVVSVYGVWERPLESVRSPWIYADASVHRLISDLSALVGQQEGHSLLVAGDLNILCGCGEGGSPYWKARYASVFDRMVAMGLPFIGPQAPEGGLQAHPWPNELPPDSRNVPTYRTKPREPESATRQLDFVFASESLRRRLRVLALNGVEAWGHSDHCRVQIELSC